MLLLSLRRSFRQEIHVIKIWWTVKTKFYIWYHKNQKLDNPISALPLFDIFNNPFAFTNFLLCWHFMIIIGSAILLLFSISICDQSFSMRGGSLTLVNKFGYRDASYPLLWCGHANKNSWVSEYKTGLKFTSQYFIKQLSFYETVLNIALWNWVHLYSL